MCVIAGSKELFLSWNSSRICRLDSCNEHMCRIKVTSPMMCCNITAMYINCHVTTVLLKYNVALVLILALAYSHLLFESFK